MQQQESSPLVQGAKIVGIAGVAAGIAGAVVGRVVESQREPSAGERLQVALAGVKGSSGSSLVDHLSDAVEQARADFEGARKKTTKQRRKDSKGKGDQADFAALAASGMSFADYMRHAILDSTQRFGETLQDVLEETTESLAKGADQSRKTSKKRGKVLKSEAISRGKDLREDADARGKELRKELRKRRSEAEKQATEGVSELMKLRKDAAGKAEDRLHDVEKRTRETVEKRVKPALEKAGAVTLAGAGEARHWLEDETKQLEKRYADVRPKLEKTAEQYAESASELARELRKAAKEQAGEAEHRLLEGTEHARELAHEVPTQARQLARDAGDAAKEGGKNATSFVVWTAIAGGLIYQVLLDDEQKRKVRELASSVFHEGKAIYEDMRGENAEFSASQET